jgi:hypothetical protein
MSDEPEILEEPAPAQKKPEGIEHDPYEWGQCSVAAYIVWTPGSSAVMVGVRTHLDAPIVTALYGDELVSLPGHAAELPIPTSEAIADLLAQLREDLPLRAQAKAGRDQAAQRKAEGAKSKPAAGRKSAQPVSAAAAPAKVPPVGKSPSATQVSLFNFMTGGN